MQQQWAVVRWTPDRTAYEVLEASGSHTLVRLLAVSARSRAGKAASDVEVLFRAAQPKKREDYF